MSIDGLNFVPVDPLSTAMASSENASTVSEKKIEDEVDSGISMDQFPAGLERQTM